MRLNFRHINQISFFENLQFGKLGFGNATVAVRDVMGKINFLQESAMNDGVIKVNLNTLSAGFYMLTVENEVLKSKEIKIGIIK